MTSGSSPRIAISGGSGFLGFHTRALLQSLGHNVEVIALGERFDAESARQSLEGADRFIHLAGVNRGSDSEVAHGNATFARQLADVLKQCDSPPAALAFANSIQAGNGTVYGQAKQEAGSLLEDVAAATGSAFIDIHLPNLFGEHGLPFYNSVTATFCHLLARGERPEVLQDKELSLMHAQHAAELLCGLHDATSFDSTLISVSGLLERLEATADCYRDGTIPSLSTDFDRDLFNTYRSYLRPEDRVFKLNRNADTRGSFFEIVRAKDSANQASFSTTVPGITRGQHYHLRKVERFAVLAGSAQISMRRLFTSETLSYEVTGDDPVAIDMPTMWSHKITNTGMDTLYTAFWSNELFDIEAPDTFAEEV